MRKLISLILLASFAIMAHADQLILRNGVIIEGKVNMVSDDGVYLVPWVKNKLLHKKGEMTIIPIEELYLIKYDKRGNVYINLDGTRKTGENQKIDKDADIIYLLEGSEIPAFGLRIDNNNIYFQKSKEKKKAMSEQVTIPTSEVFMVLYSDKSVDVFNEYKAPEPEPLPEPLPEPKEVIKVLNHTVEVGETLSSLSKLYEVSIQEIREWNSISSKVTPNGRLKKGLVIQIYKKVIE